MQLVGLGSQSHKNPFFNIDELPPGGEEVEANEELGTITGKRSAVPTVEKKRGELKEIEMVFPLKKLVQFAKAHCLDTR